MKALLGTLMEQIINAANEGKISQLSLWLILLLALSIGGLSIVGYTWASDQHDDLVSKSEFTEFAEESELRDASQTIRLLSIDLRIAKATGASDKEIDDIEKEGKRWRSFKECKRTKGQHCETLKEPE